MSSAVKQVPAADKLMLTVEEAGRLIGVGKSKAYEMVARNQIPSIDLNEGTGADRPCLRVPRQALENWIAHKTADALARTTEPRSA